MIEQVNKFIYRIPVRLPGNPLKSLNAYVVRGRDRNLLIDTGFNLPESLEDLTAGLRELSLDMNDTDIFLTHCHADHTGLTAKVASGNTRVYISEPDEAIVRQFVQRPDKSWLRIEGELSIAGFPIEKLAAALDKNPALRNVASEYIEPVLVKEGHVFDVGGARLETVDTPGHSPGHMCLYIRDEQILFTGDLVLFDITPNITFWPEMDDSLGSYFESLEKIRKLKVKLALPGHRESGDFYERIDALLRHHEDRLNEVVNILHDRPGLCGHDVASRMTWKIRSHQWDDFPLSQKIFAVGEAMSHLQYLERKGRIVSEAAGDVLHYRLTGAGRQG
ncbi:MAG: MBL fold metallo-hydrolase [Clostridiales Family XIII bacterium]|jgi:glyoxylase-like metal-dependent hydrolase (beta-lactamase superfamily II)|nr:MBL fold metallo-hydrolase [Clostridiales Family XIII bacterium]